MPVSDYTPTVDSLGALLRARTKTKGGAEAGTFNPEASVGTSEETRPTAEGVEEQIATALGDISGIIGVDLEAKYVEPARRVAALRAALLIELSYWPEQVNSDRSPYDQLKVLYDEAWANLLASMGISLDDDGGPATVDAGYPSYGGFPSTGIGMEFAW